MSYYVYAAGQNTEQAQAEYAAALACIGDDTDEPNEAMEAPMLAWENKYHSFQWRTMHQIVCEKVNGEGKDFTFADANRFAFQLARAWAKGEPDRGDAIGILPSTPNPNVRYVVHNGFRVPIFSSDVDNMSALAQSKEDWYVA